MKHRDLKKNAKLQQLLRIIRRVADADNEYVFHEISSLMKTFSQAKISFDQQVIRAAVTYSFEKVKAHPKKSDYHRPFGPSLFSSLINYRPTGQRCFCICAD